LITPHTFEFIAGCFIGLLFNRWRRWGSVFLACGLSLYIAALIILNFYYPVQGTVSGWYRVLLFGPPATLIIYGIIVFEREDHISFPAVLSQLGDISYSIYLSHILVLVVAGRLWAVFDEPGWFLHYLVLMVMVGLVIFFGKLSYDFLEAPLTNKLRTWGSGHLGVKQGQRLFN